MKKSTARGALLGGAILLAAAAAAGAEPPPHCILPGPRLPGAQARAAAPPWTAEVSPGARSVAPAGSVHLLVLLAEFADIPHRIAQARFDALLFGAIPSLRAYYEDVSGGRLAVTGDVHGWLSLPGSQFFYSQGVGGLAAYPNNGQKLAEDAVAAALGSGVDLGDYDADGDGVVDALLVIHSGEGYEWAGSTSPALTPLPDPDTINSHKWSVVDGDFGGGLPRVRDYFTCPELQRARPLLFPAWTDSIATIGVFCHEFGHLLGLPDYYDTQTSESRIGLWDLMDGGIWARHPAAAQQSLPGALPSYLSAWSKMLLGWTEAVAIAPGVGEVAGDDLTLQSVSTGGLPLQLRANPSGVDWSATAPGSGEFFLAEVRTRSGWDAGLAGDGLLLYHVDESRRGNRAADYADGAGLLLLVPQDGDVGAARDHTDPWPGVQTTFGPASIPSSALHDGSPSGVTLGDMVLVGPGQVAVSAVVTNLSSALPLPFARPNPFDPAHGAAALVISVDASPEPSAVTVFDLRGRRIRSLAAPEPPARIVDWDGRDDAGRPAPSGVYFFRMSGGAAGRVVLVRH